LDPTKTIAVEFSAWRYEKEQHLIVPLLDTIRERLVKWSEDNEQFKEQAVRTAATVGKAIYSLLAGMSLKVGIPKALEISFDANKALERADAFDKSKKEAETPRSFYHATFKALSQAFAEFLGPESGRRIVVFIDDLDRCLPQGALEVLEAMKLFFDLEGFVFVVGLDQAVVERTIDLKYKGDSTEGSYQIRGADYIKKIFQLPYAVAPVAVAQLDEFLEAVYAEGGLGVEQKNDLKHVVTPHLRYLVTDSGINPREIKRFVNAYTLIMKIKGYLEKDACLALLTLAFRRDWEVARRALLSYRTVFTDAVSRQLAGNSTAIVDLDSTFAGVPESFLSYVTAPNPGAKLLSLPNLDEYIYTGEATTGTQGSVFVDAIRDVANVTTTLRLLEAAPATQDSTQYSNYSSAVLTALSKVKSLSYGRLDRIIQTWTDHLNSFMTATKPDPDTRRKTWIDEEEAIRRRFMNQLMELYQAGTTSIASSTPA
jgi:hypothetical protein